MSKKGVFYSMDDSESKIQRASNAAFSYSACSDDSNQKIREHRMGKKGVFYSMDVTIALLAGAFFLVAVIFFINHLVIVDHASMDLIQVGTSSLATLRSSDDLSRAVRTGSMENIQIYLDNVLSRDICCRIDIYEDDKVIKSAIKTGCEVNEGTTITRDVFMPFTSGDKVYSAQMLTWYDE